MDVARRDRNASCACGRAEQLEADNCATCIVHDDGYHGGLVATVEVVGHATLRSGGHSKGRCAHKCAHSGVFSFPPSPSIYVR